MTDKEQALMRVLREDRDIYRAIFVRDNFIRLYGISDKARAEADKIVKEYAEEDNKFREVMSYFKKIGEEIKPNE